MQSRFEVKKRQILAQLDTPDEQYQDLSPKGSVDEPIRPLISNINYIEGLVTTSSCSGRISIFLEGAKKETDEGTTRTGPGGKGGGSWLYVSHAPIEIPELEAGSQFMLDFKLQKQQPSLSTFSPQAQTSYIHLKFEPMILHILTATLDDSQRVLSAALSSGFRESGAVSLNSLKTGEINPMVAVRSTGYSYDSIIGYQDSEGANTALVDEVYLLTLVRIANERFKINEERISRFREALIKQYASDGTLTRGSSAKSSRHEDWEDPEIRRNRKREEGLARQRQLQADK